MTDQNPMYPLNDTDNFDVDAGHEIELCEQLAEAIQRVAHWARVAREQREIARTLNALIAELTEDRLRLQAAQEDREYWRNEAILHAARIEILEHQNQARQAELDALKGDRR